MTFLSRVKNNYDVQSALQKNAEKLVKIKYATEGIINSFNIALFFSNKNDWWRT